MPATTSPRATRIDCALHLSPTGDRRPLVVLTDAAGTSIAAIPTSDIDPELPLSDRSIAVVTALDVLEHVHDEQTWLAEFARVLQPGGTLEVRVPLENPVAWLDALNVYRYFSDVVGRGRVPREMLPTGWHRHYAPGDVPAIVALAGFHVDAVRPEGLPLSEPLHLAGLLVGDALLGRHHAERRLFALRQRVGRSTLRMPRPVAARLLVRATRVTEGLDPDPDEDAAEAAGEHGAHAPLE